MKSRCSGAFLVMLSVGVTAACGGGGGGGVEAARPCALAAADSAYLGSAPLYPECAVDREARLVESSAREDFRPTTTPQSLPASMCYRALVRLVVDAGGRPELRSVRLVQASDPTWGQAVITGVAGWRFEAAVVGGVPVRQVVEVERKAAIRVVPLGQGRGNAPPRC